MRERSPQPAPAKSVAAELMHNLELVAREKGIDVEILISALEDAITTASRKHQERTPPAGRPGGMSSAATGSMTGMAPGASGPSGPVHGAGAGAGDGARPRGQENLISRLNRQTGEIQVSARMRVVETVADELTEISLSAARARDPEVELGGFYDIPRSTKGLGRIEAQAAKQVILQKVREAERELVYNEFAPKVGEIANGTVKRYDRGDVVVELGRTEAVLPRRYQARVEQFAPGDRLRAIVLEVTKNPRGPQVFLSRIETSLLVKLFEMEVPEIYDGTVSLRQAVREPGERAKVAVASREKDVDPVGACVGMKGSRVQAIIRELKGEKIDIVQWSEDVSTFAANALNPARVGRVAVVEGAERVLEAVVEDAQLSLAIGKKGQNVRLASKLVGWKIDIRSEEEKRQEAERTMTALARGSAPLSEVPGIDAATAKLLLDQAGVATVSDLLRHSAEKLADAIGRDVHSVAAIRSSAETYLAGGHGEGGPGQPEAEPRAAAGSHAEGVTIQPEGARGAEGSLR